MAELREPACFFSSLPRVVAVSGLKVAGAITRFFPEDVLLKYLGWYSRPLALQVLATGLICSCSLLLEAIRCNFNFSGKHGKILFISSVHSWVFVFDVFLGRKMECLG